MRTNRYKQTPELKIMNHPPTNTPTHIHTKMAELISMNQIKMMLFKTNYLNVVLMAKQIACVSERIQTFFALFSRAVNETALSGLLLCWMLTKVSIRNDRKRTFNIKNDNLLVCNTCKWLVT